MTIANKYGIVIRRSPPLEYIEKQIALGLQTPHITELQRLTYPSTLRLPLTEVYERFASFMNWTMEGEKESKNLTVYALAVARLYPSPEKALETLLRKLPHSIDFVWKPSGEVYYETQKALAEKRNKNHLTAPLQVIDEGIFFLERHVPVICNGKNGHYYKQIFIEDEENFEDLEEEAY